MIPKSLSASSILVSEACMERWKVENFHKTPQGSSEPANIGTTCHYALEHFVYDVYLEPDPLKRIAWSDIAKLVQYYKIGYIETFGSTDFDTEAFHDGEKLVAAWYDRNKNGLPNKVLSCEIKENFSIKTSAGEIPFNFIYDRLDQIEEDVYEVVDYKSIRAYIKPEDLKRKIQPRAYALAAQIKFPNAKRIWVSFDMLRHDGPVGVVFDRDENAATYRYLKRAAERIIATDEDATTEQLNDECKWCIRKANCDTLLRANAGGTWHGMDPETAAQRKLEISTQILALKYADEELDKVLMGEAERRDEFEFELGSNQVTFSARPTRKANSNAVLNIVGPELGAKYGNFTITNIDKMLKSGELSPDQVSKVKAEISTTWSQPTPKIKPIGEFK